MIATSHGGAAAALLRSRPDPAFRLPSQAGEKIASFLDRNRFDRPTLVLDIDRVAERYRALAGGLAGARIHYAVKANPHPQVIARLVGLGSRFDAASRAEIELCLAQGADPADISFGNTVKRPADIAWAHGLGIDLFAADAEEELAKLATFAPGARVCLRLLIEHSQADWPLGRKFGCAPEEALRLIGLAQSLGLRPVGLSFHVGSQTREAAMWRPALDLVAGVWRDARAAGFRLEILNIGGGFPASYGEPVQDVQSYCADVLVQIRNRIGSAPECVMAEPGRGLVAESVADFSHHFGTVGLGVPHRLAVECRKSPADVEDLQWETGGAGVAPDPGHQVENRAPHRRLAGLAADMERQAHRAQPQAPGLADQAQRLLRRAAELAAQRPVGLAVLDQQAQTDPGAGSEGGELGQLLLRVGRKQVDPEPVRPGDIGRSLHRVAKGNVSRISTLRQADLDLGAAGGVEARAQPHQPGDHPAVRVGLDGIVDPGTLQPPREHPVALRHAVDVEHQCRPLEAVPVEESGDLFARLRGQAEGRIWAGAEQRRSGAPMRSGNHRRSP